MQCPGCRGQKVHKSYGHHRTYVEPCEMCLGTGNIPLPQNLHIEQLFKFDSCVPDNRQQFLDKDLKFTQDDLYPKTFSNPFL